MARFAPVVTTCAARPGPWRASWRLGALVLGAAGTVSACGSGALDPPGQDDAPTPATASGSEGADTATGNEEEAGGQGEGAGAEEDGEEEDLFSWGLPSGPPTPADTREDDVYIPLSQGQCEEAQTRLEAWWPELDSPRTVLLYQAGIDMCGGDAAGAADWFAGAEAYGWAGVNREFFVVDSQGADAGTFAYDCEVYRSLSSVLAQMARESVECPGGEAPPWDTDFGRLDPRVEAEEPPTDPDGTTDPDGGTDPDSETGPEEEPTPTPTPTSDSDSVTAPPTDG